MFVLTVCLLLSGSAFSEVVAPDISDMSIDELLSLRDEIDVLLEEKGYRVYFDIERGAKGEEVSLIQVRLSELGFYSGKITGKFDSETQKAFKQFEKANGLNNDGLASREDQLVLFGDAAVAQTKPDSTPSSTPIPQESNKHASEHDVSFDYEHCLRYPESHIGEEYTLKGKVEQALGNRTDGFELRFSILGNSAEILYVSIDNDPGYNILDGDWLIIDLTMFGTVTYTSIWGQEITIPYALASNVTLR